MIVANYGQRLSSGAEGVCELLTVDIHQELFREDSTLSKENIDGFHEDQHESLLSNFESACEYEDSSNAPPTFKF